MNFKLAGLAFVFFLSSCSEKKDETISETSIPGTDSVRYVQESETETSTITDLESNPTFQKWLNFYRSSDDSMSMGNFNLEESKKLEMQPGNVAGIFDSAFDKTYEPFLIYNPSKTFYLDIDSYHWTLEKEGMPLFEADQEINLVNLKEKTVNRVAFFGPSYWVDDAFWVSDSIFILLENNFDNQPDIQVFNLKENIISQYGYSDSTRRPIEPAYILERLESRGIISPN